MTLKHSAAALTGVPETLLIPLYARAQETQRPGGICSDPLAVTMLERIDYDFSRFAAGHASALGIAIRTEILDELTRAYLAQHPDAVVVNIAAGLDTRFFRVDTGRCRWYELDLPESIALRRRLLDETERHPCLAASALDHDWLAQIERRPPTLIIVEGLLMYFREDEVQRLLLAVAQHFPGAELLLEVMGRTQAQRTDQNDLVSHTAAVFQWGLRHAADLATWHPRLRYLTDVSIYDRHAERWHALPLTWPASLAALRNTVNRIVHLRVADSD
ncbi:MAG: class I SAM-dependent methyltransferase [Anaerolineae bacterium]|jgi:methyltransferase (TIGR00027 family)|nr:class I SAM-dependent methyltransferase [Anaerolineae bacterium]